MNTNSFNFGKSRLFSTSFSYEDILVNNKGKYTALLEDLRTGVAAQHRWVECIEFTEKFYQASLMDDAHEQQAKLRELYTTYINLDSAPTPLNISGRSQKLIADKIDSQTELALDDFQRLYTEVLTVIIQNTGFRNAVGDYEPPIDNDESPQETKENLFRSESELSFQISNSRLFTAEYSSQAESMVMAQWEALLQFYNACKKDGGIHNIFRRAVDRVTNHTSITADAVRHMKEALKFFFAHNKNELPLYLQIQQGTVDIGENYIQKSLYTLRQAYDEYQTIVINSANETKDVAPETQALSQLIEEMNKFIVDIHLESFITSNTPDRGDIRP